MTAHTDMETFVTRAKRSNEIAKQLLNDDPTLPPITAIVRASDLAGAESVEVALLANEVSFDRALFLCGSYARFAYAVRWVKLGLATEKALLAQLPELWIGSDPDDTNMEYLELWKKFRSRHRKIYNGTALASDPWITVYRGQRPNDPVGFSWTTSERVARKFANGAWARTKVDGVVLRARAYRKDIWRILQNETNTK